MALPSVTHLQISELKQLLRELPSIAVVLDWDWDEQGNEQGSYSNDSHEIELGQWLIRCGLYVSETGKTTPATYLQPSAFTPMGIAVEVEHIQLWHSEQEIDLTLAESEKIQTQIIKHIIL